MTNIFQSDIPREFYLWIDPEDFFVVENFGVGGKAVALAHPEPNHPHDNLLFIPNPNYKSGVITPYQSNIARKMRVEYYFEWYRPKGYPSRLHALYLLQNEEEAEAYRRVHPQHTHNRILIKGVTEGAYQYSLHDSGFFDWLNFAFGGACEQGLPEKCAKAYWQGISVESCKFHRMFGQAWEQEKTTEVLFYGTLGFSEEERAKIKKLWVERGFLTA